MKVKLIGVLVVLSVILFIVAGFAIKSCSNEKAKRVVSDQNVEALTKEVEIKTTANGEAYAKVQGLELSLSQFKTLYANSAKTVKAMEIKLKHAQGVIIEVPKIKYVNKDSIVYVPMPFGQKKYPIDEKYLKAEVIITNDSLIKPGDFKIKDIPDSVFTVPTIKYKGWFLWKRPAGVELYIKHTNPFITTEQAQYISLKKR